VKQVKQTYRTNISIDNGKDRCDVAEACDTSDETETNAGHATDEEGAGEVSLGKLLFLDFEGILVVRGMVVVVLPNRLNVFGVVIVMFLADLRSSLVWG
jgi:hypothetical protein